MYYYQYGYVISMIVLHGFVPAILYGSLLIVIGLLIRFICRSIHHYIHSTAKNKQKLIQIPVSLQIWCRNIFVVVSYHLINLLVTLTVNIVYIKYSIENQRIPSLVLRFIQIVLTLFKILWYSVFFPFAYKQYKILII